MRRAKNPSNRSTKHSNGQQNFSFIFIRFAFFILVVSQWWPFKCVVSFVMSYIPGFVLRYNLCMPGNKQVHFWFLNASWCTEPSTDSSKIIGMIACRAYGPKCRFKINLKRNFLKETHVFSYKRITKLYVFIEILLLPWHSDENNLHIYKKINKPAYVIGDCRLIVCWMQFTQLKHRTKEKNNFLLLFTF